MNSNETQTGDVILSLLRTRLAEMFQSTNVLGPHSMLLKTPPPPFFPLFTILCQWWILQCGACEVIVWPVRSGRAALQQHTASPYHHWPLIVLCNRPEHFNSHQCVLFLVKQEMPLKNGFHSGTCCQSAYVRVWFSFMCVWSVYADSLEMRHLTLQNRDVYMMNAGDIN